MKLEFQAKFLQHLNQKKKDDGFTLIELLVVIIIIGILAAIALPSLLGQVNKAKQAEAKNNIGTLNRAQQAYQLEYQKFGSSISELGVGIRTQTENYSYDINSSNPVYVNRGTAVKDALKSYAGLVGTTEGDATTGEVLTVAAACESINPTKTAYSGAPDSATLKSTAPCNSNYKTLGR